TDFEALAPWCGGGLHATGHCKKRATRPLAAQSQRLGEKSLSQSLASADLRYADVLPARRASVPLLYLQLDNGETIQPRPSVGHLAGVAASRGRCTRQRHSDSGSAAPCCTNQGGAVAIGRLSNRDSTDFAEWEHPFLLDKSRRDSRW